MAPPPAPCARIEGMCIPVPPPSTQREKSTWEQSKIENQLKTDSGRARGAREWRNQDPVIRTQADREHLGLAQTTSTILRSDFETDRWTSYLDPPALGREAGFPSSLGKGPRHTRFIGSEAHPEAFPHRFPGGGAGSRGRLGSCQGGFVLGVTRGPLAWTFPSETHSLTAWEANRALVLGRRKSSVWVLLADLCGSQEIDFLGISDLS